MLSEIIDSFSVPARPISEQTCYESGHESDTPGYQREFQSGIFEEWLDQLAIHGAGGMLMSLMLKLERFGKVQLEAPRCLGVMHRLMPVIRDLSDDLPKLHALTDGPVRAGSSAFCLEQRLWCLTYRCLKRTLVGLDSSRRSVIRDRNRVRLWLLDSMFYALGRHLELSVLWGWPLPVNTWQEIHDLYAYFEGRLRDVSGFHEHVVQAEDEFDAQTAYKRLLLVGLLADQGASSLLVRANANAQTDALSDWAREADLQDPSSYFGVIGTYLVEISRDKPPRLIPGALGSVSRAWVLQLPGELMAALDAEKIKRTVSAF